MHTFFLELITMERLSRDFNFFLKILLMANIWIIIIIVMFAPPVNYIVKKPVKNEGKEYGEMGKAVNLPNHLIPEVKALVEKGWKDHAFNQYVSDLISVHRSLPDKRDSWCKEAGRFLDDLPATDVIISFHNEAWSTLLRTVHSVLDRSPPELIGEIILVDDFSDKCKYDFPQKVFTKLT